MRLEFQQRHVQAISAQMQQSLKLLRMNEIELLTYIAQIAEENPLIDFEQVEDLLGEGALALDSSGKQEELAGDDADDYLEAPAPSARDEWLQDPWESKQAGETLQDDLLFQAGALDMSDDLAQAVGYIILSLDARGFLPCDVDELADASGLSAEVLMQALKVVQGLEPLGVGASDVRECLLLQVAEGSLDAQIISEHLETLARGRIATVADACGVSSEDVLSALARIAELNPNPAQSYAAGDTLYVVPEVVVIRRGRTLDVRYCGRIMEPLRIVEPVLDSTAAGGADQGLTAYLNEKRRQILWINQCMSMRARTLLSCCRAVASFQESFFLGLSSYPRSMTLGDIAQMVDMHESTVSRAVQGKYVQCDAGCISLASLFNRAVKSSDAASGDPFTREEACDMVARVIDAESKSNPLSDKRVSELLAQRGIRISRRTVAKYRDRLGIPAAAVRKIHF